MIQWFLKHAVYQTVCFYHGTGETMRNISSFWHRAPKTFVISCVHAQSFSRGQHSVTPWTVACQAPLSMDSPGKNPWVGCHFLLQGIFQTQGSNPGLPHCGQILSHWATRSDSLFFYWSNSEWVPRWLPQEDCQDQAIVSLGIFSPSPILVRREKSGKWS